MTKITQIDDRSATIAWSPIQSHADIVALGAKDSRNSGFDNYGGELELFNLGITNSNDSKSPVGSIKTTSRFSSIAWTNNITQNPTFNLGLIAGGMDNGTVAIYNPSSIMNGTTSNGNGHSSLVSSIERNNSGAISALKFNPHATSMNLLASGSSKGEILITSLDNPLQPTVASPTESGAGTSMNHGGNMNGGSSGNGGGSGSAAEITSLAWNTEVTHILAAANGNGMTTIWDLRENKPWCELRCESSGAAVSCVQWNPTQGMHLITSSSDDRNPVIKLWDLRASMSMPLATTEGSDNGHAKGILDMDWCPFDESLLVSCGKDNRTLLWDLITFQPVCELPNDDGDISAAGVSAGSQQDGMSIHQTLSGIGESSGIGGGITSSQHVRYDVKWSPIQRGVLSTCSFDRKVQAHSVLGVATKSGRPPKWMKPASGVSCGFGGSITSFASNHKVVSIATHVEKPSLKAAVEEFESATASGDYAGFSASKQEAASNVGDIYDAKVWGFMQIIFDQNARAKLLYYLGFDPENIHKVATEFQEEKSSLDMSNLSLDEAKDVTPPMSKNAEKTVNDALLVGNFEAAVECCIRSGNLADALVLASCGGAELWAQTQAKYFANALTKRPFLSVVSAVMNNKLGEYVANSDPEKWHETLAAICSYGTQEEFLPLCEALGDRLESVGNQSDASLCYMCAMNLEKASRFWQQLLEQSTAKESDDYISLHKFVEKVAMFVLVGGRGDDIPEAVGDILFEYSRIVADQGLFVSAAKYCRSQKQECKELQDRLYRSKDSQQCVAVLPSTPEFPYQYINVKAAPVRPATRKVKTSSKGRTAYGSSQSRQPTSQVSSRNGSGPVSSTQKTQNANPSQPLSNGHANTSTYTQPAVYEGQAAHSAPVEQLAPGWVEYQDPSSGRSYYANSTTGETRWEKPVSQTTAQPASDPYANQQVQHGSKMNQSAPMKLASKYGDGFVTSASHPELAAQYGNVGTSNPYSSSRPGIAVVNKRQEKAPVSGTFNVKKLTEMADSTDYKAMLDDLLAIVTTLSSLLLQGSEKKIMSEVEKGTAIFSKRLGRGDIDADTANRVGQIVEAVKNRDFSTANGIHTAMVNSIWKENKDWLKGVKYLIQLSAKRM